jgi:hypothetical protein
VASTPWMGNGLYREKVVHGRPPNRGDAHQDVCYIMIFERRFLWN